MCPKSPITYCQLLWMENTNIIISYILACTHIQMDYPLIKKKNGLSEDIIVRARKQR